MFQILASFPIKDNPEQEWFDLRQAAIDRPKGENQALMKRLKELEESGAKKIHIDYGRNTELVSRESWELVNREKELDDTVKQKEKRLLRLQLEQVYVNKTVLLNILHLL